MYGLCVYFCLVEVLDSKNDFIITVLQGEARHDIGQFDNFRRSRHRDDTLEVAALPESRVIDLVCDVAVELAVGIISTVSLACLNGTRWKIANV